jgi:hypothetical protein
MGLVGIDEELGICIREVVAWLQRVCRVRYFLQRVLAKVLPEIEEFFWMCSCGALLRSIIIIEHHWHTFVLKPCACLNFRFFLRQLLLKSSFILNFPLQVKFLQPVSALIPSELLIFVSLFR